MNTTPRKKNMPCLRKYYTTEDVLVFSEATKSLPAEIQEYIWNLSRVPPPYSPPMAPRKAPRPYKPPIHILPMIDLQN